MLKYELRVANCQDGREEVLVIISIQALNDAEALRTAHAVADMAQWGGAENVCVAVAASDGRAVGFVGDDGNDENWIERQQVKAPTYKPDTNSN